jgi:hypothetical protein
MPAAAPDRRTRDAEQRRCEIPHSKFATATDKSQRIARAAQERRSPCCPGADSQVTCDDADYKPHELLRERPRQIAGHATQSRAAVKYLTAIRDGEGQERTNRSGRAPCQHQHPENRKVFGSSVSMTGKMVAQVTCEAAYEPREVLCNRPRQIAGHAMQGRADVKYLTAIREGNGQEPTNRSGRTPCQHQLPGKAQGVWMERSDDREGGRSRAPLTRGIRTSLASRRTSRGRRAAQGQILRSPVNQFTPRSIGRRYGCRRLHFLQRRGRPWSANTSIAATKTRMTGAGRVVT